MKLACDPKKVRHKDFEKLELRVGRITGVKKLGNEYLLLIDLGPADQDVQVVADLKKGYKMPELIGKQCVVLLNICPEMVMGVESQAMLLFTTKEGKPVLISPDKKVHTGVQVYGGMDSECSKL